MRSSLPLIVERGRIRVVLAALCAMAVLVVTAAASPPQAHAAFALNKCEGAEVQGEGSSLQKNAQLNFWIPQVFDTTLYGGCGSSAPKVTFNSASSGCGLDTVGAGVAATGCTAFSGNEEAWVKPGYRDTKQLYGAADFAPSPAEEANIDNGPTGAGTAGSGQIHVIPVAGAAITVDVHFPAGCSLQDPGTGTAASGVGTVNGDTSTGGVNDPTGAPTGDLFSNQTLRVHISSQKLEEVWVGHITTWGQIVPEGDFLAGTTHTASQCAATPIIRIVREDTSGTTYNFKHYLSLLPSSVTPDGPTLWTSTNSEVGTKNTAWPLGSATETGTPPSVGIKGSGHENECIEAAHICRALEGSGGSLSNAVIATNGSIGYLDLATAREKGYDMTPNPTGAPGKGGFEETKDDSLYWIPLESVVPSSSEGSTGTVKTGDFVEPTTEAKAHFSPLGANAKGANCAGADYRGIPTTPADPTLGDWSKAIATGGTSYPVCAITYDLAFDDDAAAYNNTSTEMEAKARTVKDYLTSVVSSAGQFELPTFDYAALPLSIVEIAEGGVNAIGWDKVAGAGSGGGGGGTVTPAATTTTTTTTTPAVTPAVVAPSNAFSIASGKVKGKDIVLSLVLPDAGTLQIKATGGGVTVSNVTASVSGGQGTVTLPISSAALKKLAKSKTKKLSVTITVTFTPNGGAAATQKKTLTITQASVAGKPKTKKKKGKKG
jgi:hypothetical protein